MSQYETGYGATGTATGHQAREIALPIGILSALRPRSLMDRASMTFVLVGISAHPIWIGLILVLFHFAIPFAVLLSRPFKRNIRKLVWLAVWILFMRWLDLLWIIEPNFSQTLRITIADIVVSIAIGAIWFWYFFRNLASLPLVPAYDQDAYEVLEGK